MGEYHLSCSESEGTVSGPLAPHPSPVLCCSSPPLLVIAKAGSGQKLLTDSLSLSQDRGLKFLSEHAASLFGVNKAEVEAFLELSCFFHDLTDVGNLISGSSTFSKTGLNIWKFSVHVLLKPSLENFEHYFASM